MLRSATPGTFWKSGSCGYGSVIEAGGSGEWGQGQGWGEKNRNALTLIHALSEEPSSNGGLALAQGQGVEALSHACVLCQLEQGAGGVHTRGQDEHQGGSWR